MKSDGNILDRVTSKRITIFSDFIGISFFFFFLFSSVFFFFFFTLAAEKIVKTIRKIRREEIWLPSHFRRLLRT